MNPEELRKLVFMNYEEIVEEFSKQNIKTKSGKIITHHELRQAISIMQKKHSLCRWRSEKVRKNYYYIQYEGYLWLKDVYFKNYETKFIDKDIEWFKTRIEFYKNNLKKNKIEFPEFDFNVKKMNVSQTSLFFNKSNSTIKKTLIEYEKNISTEYKRQYNKDGLLILDEEILKWMIEEKFKQKYLELLERYKMQLTEIFKNNGGLYDNYFYRN